eukprot:649798-Rhodomonas_salina.1
MPVMIRVINHPGPSLSQPECQPEWPLPVTVAHCFKLTVTAAHHDDDHAVMLTGTGPGTRRPGYPGHGCHDQR